MTNPAGFVAGYRVQDALHSLEDALKHPLPPAAEGALKDVIANLKALQTFLPTAPSSPSTRFPSPSSSVWETPIVPLPPIHKP